MKSIIRKISATLITLPTSVVSLVLALVMGLAFVGGAAVPAYAVDSDCTNDPKNGLDISCAKTKDQANDLFGSTGIVTTVVNILLFVIGILCVVMIIYGGIRYTISRGEDKEVTGAKNTILYAVVGLVIAIIAYAIVNFVISGLTGNGGTSS
jgi:hypothetical protein